MEFRLLGPLEAVDGAVELALGSRKSSAAQNVGLSDRLMRSTEGKAVLVVIGLAITAIGCYFAYKGASRQFCNDLTVSPGRAITVLGLFGYVAEGLVLAGAAYWSSSRRCELTRRKPPGSTGR